LLFTYVIALNLLRITRAEDYKQIQYTCCKTWAAATTLENWIPV